ncbi:bis(5'-nucleosyl)-tetraphosphatase (symmetrical) YqeK [Leuconostocaceae bacterium ESL0958]|nr:bis(5'-nucleosyl)-tetraphosphatase (symmetrical) YqeK [Leuconostocaceae bacterium ESL0958]
MAVFEANLAALADKVAAKLSDKRFQHCLRVKDYAVYLAEQNEVDPEQAAVAALVHDYAKERPDADFLAMIDQQGLDPDLKNWGNPIWHGVVGAYFVKEELGIADPDILRAVTEHTTGAGHEMAPLSKIIFMADYLEAGRTFPGVAEARTITDESLNQGVFYQLSHTLSFLASQEKAIYPKTFDAYNDWALNQSTWS